MKKSFELVHQAAKLARRMHNPKKDRLSVTIKRSIEACEGRRDVSSIPQKWRKA